MSHGHVKPRPDGLKARCGGPSICDECAIEQAEITNKDKRIAELEADWSEAIKKLHLALTELDQLRELCREMRDALDTERQFLTMRGMLPLDNNHHILKALEKADAILGEGNDEPG